ncbi:MAG TPA: glycosyltransferase family 2 protein [Salinimicrobium sp.]|nr:glycosyltransferase family 2 protein [Salinimicrobium sp.]
MRKTIHIIIVNYGNWKDTIECIESILSNRFTDYQLIIVDNFSPNDSEKKIKEFLEGTLEPTIEYSYFTTRLKERKRRLPYIFYQIENGTFKNDVKKNELGNPKIALHQLRKPILFIQTGENLGFAGGNNVALQLLLSSKPELDDPEKILLLNPDTFILENTLIEFDKIECDFFVGSGIIKNYNNPLEQGNVGGMSLKKLFGIPKPIQDIDNVGKIEYLYGGALLTNLFTVRKIGLLPKEYFLYWEETDWCHRAKVAGAKFIICPDAIIFDKVGTSIGRGYLAHYYFIRNGLIFYNKYYRHLLPSHFFYNVIRCLNKLRKGEFRNAKAIFDGTKDFLKGKEGHKVIG